MYGGIARRGRFATTAARVYFRQYVDRHCTGEEFGYGTRGLCRTRNDGRQAAGPASTSYENGHNVRREPQKDAASDGVHKSRQVIDHLRKCPGEFHEKGIHSSKFWNWMPSSFGQPPWAVPWSEKYFSPRHLHEIGIEDYTAAEIEKVFQMYDLNGDGVLQRNEVANLLKTMHMNRGRHGSKSLREEDTDRLIAELDSNKDGQVRLEHFHSYVVAQGGKVDRRVWPIAASMVLTGTSVGILTPVMPMLVRQLGISAGEFGLTTSVFGLAKLLSNLPAAFFVERLGRKPFLTYGMLVMGAGVGGIGLCSSLSELMQCRILTGIGVALLTNASTLYVSDISTPLNRARTLVPLTASFSAGMALGPAFGGFLANHVGVSNTFLTVGTGYLIIMMVNRALLNETKMCKSDLKGYDAVRPREDLSKEEGRTKWVGAATVGGSEEPSLGAAFVSTVKQWGPILQDEKLRCVMALHSAYWVATSGSTMTLLPLMLVSDGHFNLGVGEAGMVFAYMAAVNVVGAQPMAAAADRFGKERVMATACTLIAGSMLMVPILPPTPASLGAVLTTWALGSSALSTTPTALVADTAPEPLRAQALALLRVVGDVGMLTGAALSGAIADASSMEAAMTLNAGALLAVTSWFTYRRLYRDKIPKL